MLTAYSHLYSGTWRSGQHLCSSGHHDSATSGSEPSSRDTSRDTTTTGHLPSCGQRVRRRQCCKGGLCSSSSTCSMLTLYRVPFTFFVQASKRFAAVQGAAPAKRYKLEEQNQQREGDEKELGKLQQKISETFHQMTSVDWDRFAELGKRLLQAREKDAAKKSTKPAASRGGSLPSRRSTCKAPAIKAAVADAAPQRPAPARAPGICGGSIAKPNPAPIPRSAPRRRGRGRAAGEATAPGAF